MKTWQIVVEGPSDGHVLHQVVKHLLGSRYSESRFQQYDKPKDRAYHRRYIFDNEDRLYITSIGGYTNLSAILPNLQYIKEPEPVAIDKNLIIFDADSLENGGGFTKRKLLLEDMLKRSFPNNEIPHDIFLFPNNNDDGMLETLLLQSLSLNAIHIRPCILKFTNCILENQSTVNVKIKDKHQASLYAWFTSEKVNASLRLDDSLKDNSTWDFGSDAFNPLRDFLAQHITPLQGD